MNLDLGRTEPASHDLNEALRLDPRDAKAWAAAARLLERQGNIQRALAAVDRAVELDATDMSFRFRRALLAHRLGNDEAASADVRVVLDRAPALPEAWVLRASIRRARGDLDGAIIDAGRALELSPRDANAFFERGEARLESDPEGARKDLRKFLELAPGDLRCLDVWAQLRKR